MLQRMKTQKISTIVLTCQHTPNRLTHFIRICYVVIEQCSFAAATGFTEVRASGSSTYHCCRSCGTYELQHTICRNRHLCDSLFIVEYIGMEWRKKSENVHYTLDIASKIGREKKDKSTYVCAIYVDNHIQFCTQNILVSIRASKPPIGK